MKICFIGKYPPIEGGEASKLYFLAKELGKKGHEVHIVTNALCVEKEFREKLRGEDLKFYQPKGVTVHNINPFRLPHFIPQSSAYVERLASLAIHVVEKYQIDVIDGWYLVPYGIAAYLASCFTKRPLFLRHAGSDLNRVARSPYFAPIIDKILKAADRVVTYPSRVRFLKEKGILPYQIIINRSLAIDPKFFSPENKISPRRYLNPLVYQNKGSALITYIGKLSPNKGLMELLEALALVKKAGKKFKLLVIGNGRQKFKKRFIEQIEKLGLREEVIINSFIPPWRIPGVIKLSILLVHPEFNFPIEVHNPILVREIMACGGCLLISKELYQKQEKEFVKNGKNIVVVSPQKKRAFAQKIIDLLDNPQKRARIEKEARKAALKREDFSRYVNQFEQFYQEVIEELPAPSSKQKLIIFRGPPAVGKTTVSQILKKKVGNLAVLKFDTIRRNISEVPTPIHRRTMARDLTEKISEFLLSQGFNVLVEGVFLHQEEICPFHQLAQQKKVEFLIFELDASDEILRQRVKNKPTDPLQGGVVNFERALRAFRISKIRLHRAKIIRINTDSLSPNQVAVKILDLAKLE